MHSHAGAWERDPENAFCFPRSSVGTHTHCAGPSHSPSKQGDIDDAAPVVGCRGGLLGHGEIIRYVRNTGSSKLSDTQCAVVPGRVVCIPTLERGNEIRRMPSGSYAYTPAWERDLGNAFWFPRSSVGTHTHCEAPSHSPLKQCHRLDVRGVREHIHDTGADQRITVLIDQQAGIARQ